MLKVYHRRRAHPRLQFESPRGKDSGRDGYADDVVDGSEDKVEPDATYGPPGEVQAADHVEQIILEGNLKIFRFYELLY